MNNKWVTYLLIVGSLVVLYEAYKKNKPKEIIIKK